MPPALLDPRVEKAPRRRIEQLQLKRARWTLGFARRSALYRHKLPRQVRLKSLDDLRDLPFTTKEELRASYPFGAVAIGLDRIVYFCATSGTSGKPTAIYFTHRDLENLAAAQARGFYAAGTRRGDRVQLIVHPTIGLPFEKAFHIIGAMTALTGPGNNLGQLALIRDLGITAVAGVPSYLLHLRQLDPTCTASVQRVLTLGEPLTDAMRRKIEDVWHAEVYDDYGSVESGAGFLECDQHDGHHLFWDHFLIETIDRQGQRTEGSGELVFTTLMREGTPLIRYRTGDLVRVEYDRCRCGRTHPRIHVQGRLGEMVKVKGTAIYPSAIRDALTAIPELLNFQVIASREAGLDVLTVRAEAREPSKGLAETVAGSVKAATNVTPRVSFVRPGTLLGERKTKQFIDLRQLRQPEE